jgi:hypothetical protein
MESLSLWYRNEPEKAMNLPVHDDTASRLPGERRPVEETVETLPVLHQRRRIIYWSKDPPVIHRS